MSKLMAHDFSTVPRAEMQRSTFKRPSRHLTTFGSGFLVPIFIDEVLPGDTFKMNAQIFARMPSQKVPIMDNLYMDTFWFYVPNRLLWKHWVNFMGEQDDVMDPVEYIIPTIRTDYLPGSQTEFQSNSLEDYFGLPVGVANLEVCSFWHRAYSKIYNDWFRDQNLCEKAAFTDEDSDLDQSGSVLPYMLKKRGKRHDYFTSALPWPQAGEPVTLPVGGSAPVFGNNKVIGLRSVGANSTGENFGMVVHASDVDNHLEINTLSFGQDLSNYTFGAYGNTNYPGQKVGLVPKTALTPETYANSGMYADLSVASAIYINDLRTAIQTQKFLERNARGGHRYIEILLSHFQVVSPDARLQRSEYLGGNNSYVNIHPIAQTSSTGATGTPQANLAAMATISHKSGFTKSFTEHGVLMGIVNVRADLTYQQGLHRMFKRQTRLDFMWPVFCGLGEEPIFNYEIYAQGSAALNPVSGLPYDDEVFGYKPRYDEYRYSVSKITGLMRSTVTTAATLHQWHLSQNFVGLPQLNQEFIDENIPIDRCLAVTDQPEFIADMFFDLTTSRCMPIDGVPGYMDHF